MAKKASRRRKARPGGEGRQGRQVAQVLGELHLAQDLVALREKRGLSQRELAERMGASQPYVAKLESGRVENLGLRTLVKCALALGASLRIELQPEASASPSAPAPAHPRASRASARA
jgi:transcriptional regulator with XRE-family HTH domain